MNNKLPQLVSIGLPVYNGERYVQEAIESLLSQDYDNFELIISDNASTDATFKICQEYQLTDQRIRLYKNDSNIGAARNFNQVFHLSAGKYFMWAAHDDLWDKSYISKCMAKLTANPHAVMCVSGVWFIDEFGNKRPVENIGMETIGMDVAARVHMLMARMFWYEIYGVIRSEYLRKTNLVGENYGPDVVLLMELLLLGEFVKVPDKLFLYRRRPYYERPADEEKSYTGLARELLMVILKSGFDDAVKYQMLYEFIKCLSLENRMWRNLILNENKSKLPPVINVQNLPQIMYGIIIEEVQKSMDERVSICGRNS